MIKTNNRWKLKRNKFNFYKKQLVKIYKHLQFQRITVEEVSGISLHQL
jgi:hypothetical protein